MLFKSRYLCFIISLLLPLLTGYLPYLRAWKEINRQCAAGCEDNGNCNRELGLCECNFGFAGPSCSTRVLPACHTSLDPKSLPLYGFAVVKNCECYRQILSYGKNPSHHPLPWERERLVFNIKACFERKNTPAEKQLSDPPLTTDTDFKWMEMINDPPLPTKPPEKLLMLSAPVGYDKEVLPLSKCPDRCNDRGICLSGKCLCTKGFTGTSCEGPCKICLDDCGGGKCIGGFCHCPKGHWGMGCTRSKAYAPDPAIIAEVNDTGYSRTVLKIYRYELPWNISFPWEFNEGNPTYNHLYGGFEEFYKRLGKDNAVVTENPGEANLFYIPSHLPLYESPGSNDRLHVSRILTFVRDTYPAQWKRNQGKDHFIFLPNDLGACWLTNEALLQNPIKVVHWGLQIKAADYTAQPNYHFFNNPTNPMREKYNKEYSCFKFEKDVLAASNERKGEVETKGFWEKVLKGEERKYLISFLGSIRPQQFEYSGGARQAYQKYVNEKHDPMVDTRGSLSEATFCFAPYGDGWGSRLTYIALSGCIPVIVQDYVHQPYDDVLPYQDFSVRLRVKDIPMMLDILKGITKQEIQNYRQTFFKYYKAFYWSPDGEAYQYTLRSLRRKLTNLWSMHY